MTKEERQDMELILKVYKDNIKNIINSGNDALLQEEKNFPENKYYDKGLKDSIKILKATLGLSDAPLKLGADK